MTAVSSEFLAVDPYLKNASSSAVKFDISHKNGHPSMLQGGRQRKNESGKGALEISVPTTPSREWEVDVRLQVSTQKWLQSYGLRKARLHMSQILEVIGFKLCDDFDSSLKRPVSSRYGQGMFQQIAAADGKTFNLACDREKLLQLKKRLMQSIALYKRRLEWLTSESRRIFGVVEEKAVTIVMDIRNMSPDQFDQYRAALERVMREQFHNVTKFNLIRAAEDMQFYCPQCIPFSHDTLEAAIQWMWNLDRLAPVSNTACAESVLRALLDRHNEAIYLFTEGTSINCGRELLLEKVTGIGCKIPVHVVSFNCDNSDTIQFLRNFATITGGRFHAYAVMMETESYEPPPSGPTVSKANVLLKRKTFGGVAAGAGVRQDVVLLFEEIEEARNNLQQLEILIARMPEPNRALQTDTSANGEREKGVREEKDEQYMSSKQWLSVYGIDARKLNLHDVLSAVTFRHQDGVVEVLEKPSNDQTDAVGQEKLVNAQYCEKFPVVRGKDGRVLHVHVTPEVHRTYEQRMHVALNAIQQRVDWLKQGSRALFGTVVEEEVYILIDTSASMQHSIQFVKERLFVLMQEQLRHKSKFNLVAFNSKVMCWRDRLMEVNEKSLQSAWNWVQGLTCWGSTNTYAALQTALSDTHTQAIYLLTDGRPDQSAKSILAQVRMQNHVPIHPISFNCNDNDANQFLYDLAHATGGRYHYFAEHGNPVEHPDAWQSEDIKLLKDEIERGFDYLDRLAELRDQCSSMAWRKEVDALKTCTKGHALPDTPGRISAVPSLDPRDLFRPSSAPPQSPRFAPVPPARPSSAVPVRSSRARGLPKRPQSAKAHRGRKLVAAHTRTSMLRTQTSSGRFSPSEWLLPETAKLFEQQSSRDIQLAEYKGTTKQKKRKHKMAKSKTTSSKQWLKKNGLVAKRLTILDALAPTLVAHRSTYIPVLDKRVMARVFDNILPFAHVSGRQKNKVHLVNPNGVNLIEYEEKLEKAMARYRRRLDTIVWNALPESVKEEFDAEDQPVSFSENRTKFLLTLSEEGWPVSESDIAALEKEIAKGEKFLQQSKDLRHAVTNAGPDDASTDVSSPHSEEGSASEEAAAVSESVDQVLQVDNDEIITVPTTPRVGSTTTQSPHPPDIISPRSRTPQPARNSTPRSQEPRTPRPPDNPMPPSSHPNITPCRSIKKKRDQDDEKCVGRGKGRVTVCMLRGNRVIARNHTDGLYYPGKVVRCPNVRRATVEFTFGPREVLTQFILPISGAVPCPPLSVGDYGLVQVMNLTEATECYVPCIVQFTPQRRQAQSQFYTVMLYNGQKVTTRRSHLYKISKERFELSVRYITEVQGEDRTEVEDRVYVHQNRDRSSSSSASSDTDIPLGRRRPWSKPSSPPTRPRSPTPGVGMGESPSPSRSRPDTCQEEAEIAAEEDNDGRRNSDGGFERRSYSPSPDREEEAGEQRSTSPLTDRQRELKRLKKQLKQQERRQAEEKKKLKKKMKKLSQMNTRLLERLLDERRDEEQEAEGEPEPEEEAPIVTPRILHLRRTLPELQATEEVLARFSDDGWYYRGTIQQNLGDLSCIVKDATGYIERIWRENIISDYDDNAPPLKEDDRVIAQYPHHSGSYAPGNVLSVDDILQTAKIQFYDGQEESIPRAEVYRLPREKYNHDVLHIQQCEKGMLGRSVVARDDSTGEYFPGQIMEVVQSGRNYLVRWSDGSQAKQMPVHIFSAVTRRYPLMIGDRVLAIANPQQVVFLPGQIVGAQERGLVVQFCNGQVRDDVNPLLCYWVTQGYFEEASYFWKINQPDFGKRQMYQA